MGPFNGRSDETASLMGNWGGGERDAVFCFKHVIAYPGDRCPGRKWMRRPGPQKGGLHEKQRKFLSNRSKTSEPLKQ